MDNAAASQWMRGVRREDAAAVTGDFEELVRLCQPKIFRFVLASLRDRDAAQTVTQDCFMKAFQARHRFRHECSVETWLMRIAINLVRDHTRNRRWQFWRRAEQTSKPVEGLRNWLGDGQPSPEAQTSLKQQVAAIWEAAGSLPERQRTVFLLRFVEDMDLLDIAAATGMREGTVKSHLFRALQAVRERMGASE
jgi:RNA polymerase sigma-70 factor (ECF subfamily)